MQFPQKDLTLQYISSSYQDVVQQYLPTGSTEYLLDGYGNVILSIPSSSYGDSVITSNKTSSITVLSSSYSNQSLLSQIADISLVSETSISASYSLTAVSASWAPDQTVTVNSASWASQSLSASYAPFTQTVQVSASWASQSLSSSYSSVAETAQAINFVPITANSASWVSASIRITTADTASYYGGNVISASYVSGSTSILNKLYINTAATMSSSALIISQSMPVSQSFPVLDMVSTWSGSTTQVFTGIRCNIIDSGSSISSKLIDIQRNGSSVLSLTRNSDNFSVLAIGANSNVGGVISNYTTDAIAMRPQNNVIAFPNSMALCFGNTTSQNLNLTCDTWLGRETSGKLSISTGYSGATTNGSSSFANAGLRLYCFNSSSANNFERAANYWSGSNYYISTEYSGSGLPRNIVFQTSSSNRLFISASGNVGIGTITPAAKLHVNNLILCDGGFGSTNGSGGGRFGYNDGTNWGPYWNFNTSNIGAPGAIKVGIGLIAPTSKLHISGSTESETLLYVQNQTGSNLLFISSSGKIGIGTSNPSNKLDVIGNISCSVVTSSLHGADYIQLPYSSSNKILIPTVQTGSMYFNTTNNLMYVYNGISWVSSSFV